MISRVSAATASLIFAGTTAKVPSGFTLNAPASSSVLSCRAMPLPCASVRPKRMERKVEARNVVYIVRSSSLSSTPLSTRYCSAQRPGDVGLGLLERAVGLLQLLRARWSRGRRP